MHVAAIEPAFPPVSHPSQSTQLYQLRALPYCEQMGERTERIALGIVAAQRGETRIMAAGGARK